MSAEDTDVICQVDEHIALRKWRDDDAEIVAPLASDPEVWNRLSDRMPHPYTVTDARDWIARSRRPENKAIAGPSLENTLAERVPTTYIITFDGQPCGSVGLDFGSGVYRLGASLGYWLGVPYHSKGIMSRAVPAFVDWTWKTFGYLVRLNGTAYATNIASQRIMQKAGFVLESTRINGCVKNGVVCDEVTLGAQRPKTT